MNKVTLRDPKCNQCKLSTTCKNVCVMADVNTLARLMIVGDFPDKYDDVDKKAVPLHGKKYDILHTVLKEDRKSVV